MVPSIFPFRSSWKALAVAALLGCSGVAGAQGRSHSSALDDPTGKTQAPSAPGTDKDSGIKLETPAPAQIFQFRGERTFLETIRRDLRGVTKTTEVPKDVGGPSLRRPSGPLPPAEAHFLPNVVCYKPLYFEQVGPERYAEDAGHYVQPFISACRFYADVILLPAKMAIQPPHWSRECNDADPSRGPVPLAPVPGGALQPPRPARDWD